MLLERLSRQTGWSIERLLAFSASAGRRYKTFEVPKRSGGTRLIEQPARPVKAVQRWVVKALFEKYPIHRSAFGYRKQLSVRNNAIAHSGFAYTLRLDFTDFFGRFTHKISKDFCRRILYQKSSYR